MTAQPTITTAESEIGELQNSIISAFSYAGFEVTTATGKPARLVVIDEDGNVIDAGASVSIAAWNVAIKAYRGFLQGTGHLRAHSSPPAGVNA